MFFVPIEKTMETNALQNYLKTYHFIHLKSVMEDMTIFLFLLLFFMNYILYNFPEHVLHFSLCTATSCSFLYPCLCIHPSTRLSVCPIIVQ